MPVSLIRQIRVGLLLLLLLEWFKHVLLLHMQQLLHVLVIFFALDNISASHLDVVIHKIIL